MLLQRLREYSERLNLPPTLYNESPVRYIIDLDSDGHPVNRRPMDTADPSNPRTRRGQRRLVPQVQRSVGIKPLLLADKADYTLGICEDPQKEARAHQCHSAYLELLDRCARATGEPAVAAVKSFLESEPLSQLDLPEDFDPGALITFTVDGVFPIDLFSVRGFWAAVNDPAADPEKKPTIMQCLVCGKESPVLDRLQGKIKGVPGGQTAGTSIISANSNAFESYGLEASLIAPTCPECGERFTKALNDLLAGESTRITLGGMAFVFWTREDVPFSFLDYVKDPKPEEVKKLIASVRSGQWMPEVDGADFYATALSGSGGRAVVRDWIDTTVGQVKEQLSRWFQRQAIVGSYGEAPQPLGLYALATSTVREAGDLAPPTPRALLRSALLGSPLPMGLLYQAVRRNRAEQGITRPRASLIKLVLQSNRHHEGEDRMVQLDSENLSPAYRCGRLLAVLEEVQRLAVPGIKATIVDRFFGTASSAPSSVFGRLVRGAQPHLGKLERDRPGAYRALQARLEEIQAGLSSFPRVLTLEEQGLFALGYYHQRAWDRMKAREAAERRRAGQEASEGEVATEDNEDRDGADLTAHAQ